MEEKLTELPRGWVWTKLLELFTIIRGVSFPKEAKYYNYEDGLIACLRTANVQKEIDWDNLWFIDQKYLRRCEQIIRKNDILISTANSLELLGKISRVKQLPYQSTLGTFIVLLRTLDGLLHPNYAYYYLSFHEFQSEVRSRASTTTNISNISVGKLGQIYCRLAPLSEQHRIVSKIEELFTKLDAGVEALKKVKTQLKLYRQAVLEYAFKNNVVSGKERNIRSLSSIVTSGSRGWAQYYSDRGAKFIRIGNLTRDGTGLNLSHIQRVNLPEKAEGLRSRLQEGDLLISITADLGSIGIVPNNIGEAYINQHIALIRLHDERYSKFIAWFLKGEIGRNRLLTKQRGATKIGLGLDDIRDLIVPFPDVKVALSVVEKIESSLSICNNLGEVIDQCLVQAEVLRQSILKKAFEGKLVPQDPSDEPAEKLLERIKAEKGKDTSLKNKGKRSRT